ncbi:hypothetical protein IWX49DRAFT_210577 [Phyllosticta citricarpa]
MCPPHLKRKPNLDCCSSGPVGIHASLPLPPLADGAPPTHTSAIITSGHDRNLLCQPPATTHCRPLVNHARRLNCFLPFAWASEAEEPALVWLAEEAQRRDEVKRATRTTTAGLSLLERSNTRTNSRVPLPVLLQRLSFTKPACYASPPLHPRHSPSLVLHHAPHTASPIPVASQTVDSFTTFKVAAAHVSLVPDWPARANVRRGSCPPARLLLGRQGTERR